MTKITADQSVLRQPLVPGGIGITEDDYAVFGSTFLRSLPAPTELFAGHERAVRRLASFIVHENPVLKENFSVLQQTTKGRNNATNISWLVPRGYANNRYACGE